MVNPFAKIIFTEDGLRKEKDCYFHQAEILYKKGKFDKALKCLYYSSMVEWLYPINHSYIDEPMETLLEEIANEIIKESNDTNKGNTKRVVLYNGQFGDSAALTEQYLHYLLDHDYEVLFVVFGRERCYGKGILKLINSHPKVKVCIPSNADFTVRIKEIYRTIVEFDPSIAFLHFLPNDVIGYCVFSKLNNLTRYYIVHNDHTFWLGKNCSDYFLEYRSFGRQIAIERRGISEDTILMLPYYPMVQDVPFKGFPSEVKDKVIGMSGATLYKYAMDPELKYFHAIKKLLLENNNFVFFLAGGGSPKEVELVNSFIRNEGLESRFYYVGHRPDFYSFVGNVDILFESYPFVGGLTILYATNQKKPVVGIARPDTISGVTEDNLDLINYRQPRNFDEFHEMASRLIQDASYRQYIGEIVADNQFKKDCFDKNLTNIIKGGKSIKLRRTYSLSLDDKKILSDYLNLTGEYRYTLYANKYNYVHCNFIFSILKSLLFLRYQGVGSFYRRVLSKLG